MSTEQKTAEQWNKAIENSLVKTGYGLVSGLTASFIFCRGPVTRAAIVGLAAGIGMGVSLMENKALFEKKE